MRSRMFVPVAAVTVVLALATSSAIAADPNAGLRFQFEGIGTELTQPGLWTCAAGDGPEIPTATLSFGVAFGRNIEMASETQGPTTWRDIDFRLQVYDCSGEVVYDLEGGSHDLTDVVGPERMWIIPLTSAALEDVEFRPFIDADHQVGVRAFFDLTWAAPPTATVLRMGYDQVPPAPGRTVDAVVSGVVSFSNLDGPWGDSITFRAGNEHSARLQSFNDIAK
jgi:hypothetical protein